MLNTTNIHFGTSQTQKYQLSLHQAAAKGYSSVVRDKAAMEPASINSADAHGLTPLHWAASKGHAKTLQALLNPEGRLLRITPDLNAKDRQGKTPLHYAARYGQPKAIAVLIQAGADTKIKDYTGKTPLDTARKFGQTAAVEAFENPEAIGKKSSLNRFFGCFG